MKKTSITFLFLVMSSFLFSQQVIEFKNGSHSENVSLEVNNNSSQVSKNTTSSKSTQNTISSYSNQNISDEVAYAISYYDSLYFSPNELNGQIKLIKKKKDGTLEEQQLITNYFFSPAVSQLSSGNYYLVFFADSTEYYLKLDIQFPQ